MNFDLAYLALNAVLLPAWALLLFAPKSTITKQLVHSGVYPVCIGFFYIVCFGAAAFWGQAANGFSFFTLEGVAILFDHPNGVLIGWSHFLAFDLFVGAWVARDAQRRDYNHLIVAPMILLSYLYGPIGLIAYMIFRWVRERRLPTLEES